MKSPVVGKRPEALARRAGGRSASARSVDSRLLQLQQAIGNRRLADLFHSVGHAPACTGAGCCASCGSASSVHAKLPSSRAREAHEREADRAADVMVGRASHAVPPGTVRRPAPPDKALPLAQAPAVSKSLLNDLGPDRPLDDHTRDLFERQLGRPLGDVRIHVGRAAEAAAEAVGARAFTVGRHVAFGRREYAPGSEAGRRLLAHEVAHVVQQTGGLRQGRARNGRTRLTAASLAIQRKIPDSAPAGPDPAVAQARSALQKARARLRSTDVPVDERARLLGAILQVEQRLAHYESLASKGGVARASFSGAGALGASLLVPDPAEGLEAVGALGLLAIAAIAYVVSRPATSEELSRAASRLSEAADSLRDLLPQSPPARVFPVPVPLPAPIPLPFPEAMPRARTKEEARAEPRVIPRTGNRRRWSCEASCNVEGRESQCTGRVRGAGTGPSEEIACREAKRDATQQAPLGCYARHCRCLNCHR